MFLPKQQTSVDGLRLSYSAKLSFGDYCHITVKIYFILQWFPVKKCNSEYKCNSLNVLPSTYSSLSRMTRHWRPRLTAPPLHRPHSWSFKTPWSIRGSDLSWPIGEVVAIEAELRSCLHCLSEIRLPVLPIVETFLNMVWDVEQECTHCVLSFGDILSCSI